MPVWRSFLAEWPKIRRRSVLIAAVAMIGITGLSAYFALTRAHSQRTGPELVFALEQSGGLVSLLEHGAALISLISLITVGAVLGAEWSQGTLRNLLIQEPGRVRMLAGKFLALLVYLDISALLAVVVGVAVATLAAPSGNVDTTQWWTADGVTALLDFTGNLMLAVVGWSIFGAFVAVIVRSPAGAVGVAIGWLLVMEGLVSEIWPDFGQWLPGHLLSVVLKGGSDTISYGAALGWSAVYVVALALVAAVMFTVRDVLA